MYSWIEAKIYFDVLPQAELGYLESVDAMWISVEYEGHDDFASLDKVQEALENIEEGSLEPVPRAEIVDNVYYVAR